MSVGLESYTDEFIKYVDIDGNGTVTSADALSILRYSVGLIDKDKIGTAVSKTTA